MKGELLKNSYFCPRMEHKIEFSLFGLDLLEPMAFVTNMVVVITCMIAYLRTRELTSGYARWWKAFFISFALASFFGALSHVFWNYWWFYGKIPSWFFGVVATTCSAFAMLEVARLQKKVKNLWRSILLVRAMLVLAMAYFFWKFLFVAIDTIVIYISFAGIYGAILWRKGYAHMRYNMLAMVFLIPTGFIFLLKIDLHEWMNREDLSHLLMCVSIFFFSEGVRKEISSQELAAHQ
jgi:hypothetical protein